VLFVTLLLLTGVVVQGTRQFTLNFYTRGGLCMIRMKTTEISEDQGMLALLVGQKQIFDVRRSVVTEGRNTSNWEQGDT
jgi:hypothetical protein